MKKIMPPSDIFSFTQSHAINFRLTEVKLKFFKGSVKEAILIFRAKNILTGNCNTGFWYLPKSCEGTLIGHYQIFLRISAFKKILALRRFFKQIFSNRK